MACDFLLSGSLEVMTVRWLLMNKDTPVMSFISSTDEYGEVVLSEEDWLSDRKPLGYISITSFVERRKAPKHRKHIEELLIRYGCDDLEGFLNVAHALSLNDTLWVWSRRSDGDDTLLYNRGVNVRSFSLPASYQGPQDTLIFLTVDTLQNFDVDTVWISKEDIPHFESVDCAVRYFHKLWYSWLYSHHRQGQLQCQQIFCRKFYHSSCQQKWHKNRKR